MLDSVTAVPVAVVTVMIMAMIMVMSTATVAWKVITGKDEEEWETEG
jgi:hypothetical protein